MNKKTYVDENNTLSWDYGFLVLGCMNAVPFAGAEDMRKFLAGDMM